MGDFGFVEFEYVAVGAVVRRPDDLAAVGGEFLWGAEVVELVVVDLCVFAFAL